MLKKVSVIAIALALCLVFGYSTAGAINGPVNGNGGGVVVTRGGIGDGLIYDLYDIRDTDTRSDLWQNYFVIENTSGSWTAAHLRLRSWKKSIEVWDHVILLSPRDVFWCVIERAAAAGTTSGGVEYAEGDAIIRSGDTKTLLASGLIYPPDTVWTDILSEDLLAACGFTPGEGEDDLQGELQAGYIEAIGLWQLEVPDYYGEGSDDTHDLTNVVADLYHGSKDTGVINIYDLLEAGFYKWYTSHVKRQSWPDTALIRGSGPSDEAPELGKDRERRYMLDCGNILAGSFERGDLTSGRYEMGNFLAVRNFRTEMETTTMHRDGSELGAIVFPVLALDSQPYNVGQNNYPDVDDAIEDAFYVNESYTSTNGPGWRDGDDLWEANAPCGDVADFNNIWSLDDLERALQSGNLWSHFYNMHDGVDYWTDLALTFPTKHYHWLFANFPWWNDGGDPVQCPGGAAYISTDWFQDYADRVASFRAGVKAALEGVKNGPVGAFHLVWNMEEDLPIPPPPIPSPRVPDFGKPIPHEVNLISVGDDILRDGYGIGIHGGDPVLYTNYMDGQFTIGPFVLKDGGRALGFNAMAPHDIYGYEMTTASRYYLPSVMEILFTHAYLGDVAIRSTCSPVKFDHVFELDGLLELQPWETTP
jgi:hypothetical protein